MLRNHYMMINSQLTCISAILALLCELYDDPFDTLFTIFNNSININCFHLLQFQYQILLMDTTYYETIFAVCFSATFNCDENFYSTPKHWICFKIIFNFYDGIASKMFVVHVSVLYVFVLCSPHYYRHFAACINWQNS